jgi:hypothetical protein
MIILKNIFQTKLMKIIIITTKILKEIIKVKLKIIIILMIILKDIFQVKLMKSTKEKFLMKMKKMKKS